MNEMHARLGAAIDDDVMRFSGADFADGRLGAVLGSVKRRRAARAAGVSSVSVLGASALAVGAVNVPWSSFVLGASPASQPSVVCTTTTPDAATAGEGVDVVILGSHYANETPVPESETSPQGVTKTSDGTPSGESWSLAVDGDTTGKVQVSGDELTFELVGGPVTVLKADPDGNYRATLGDGTKVTFVVDADELTFTQSTDGASAAPSPSVDCVTTTPEPSESATPTPTVSASPTAAPSTSPSPIASQTGDVATADSPFQCGYVFETDKGGSDTLQIFGASTTDSEIHSIFDEWYGNQAPTTDVGDSGAVAFRAALAPAEVHGATSTRDPASDESVATSRNYDMPSVGFTFVAVRDGAVVGTVIPGDDGQTPGVVVDRASENGAEEAFMWDLDALTPCGASSIDGAQIYAVAGYGQDGEFTYAWHYLPE